MYTAFPILGAVLLLVLILFFIQILTLAWVKRRSRLAIQVRYTSNEIIIQSLAANFFGQTSKGKWQVRGNGALVLTEDELWFRMAIPRKELVIPLKQITNISIAKSHLGKSKLRPLLLVEFDLELGSDSAAWLVEDLDEWVQAIRGVGSL
jgi:hypothetical protein